jgi:YD repeat-containing protein
MKTRTIVFLMFLLACTNSFAQSAADSLTDELKAKALDRIKHFTFGFYIDTYVNLELDKGQDTSNIAPYSGNSPFMNQFRLNVASVEMAYNAEIVRGKLQLQFGDAPNLLASPEKQFIKTMRQAYVGFRIVKNLWVDVGYQFTPVGIESSWPVGNWVSSVSMCGYFEPGAILGAKISYKISEKVNCGFEFGNPYSLAYQQTNHLAGILWVNYLPTKTLTLSYDNMFGNQALKDAKIKNNLLYNDVLIDWEPSQHLGIIGQFDFAFQTNSKMAPDTTQVASMCSGFVQARYAFLKHFSLTGRYEYYYDPDGFLSGHYTYDGKTTGLCTNGMSLSLEYKPVKIAYIRLEYKYIHANKGNMVYYSKTNDFMQNIILTMGVRF